MKNNLIIALFSLFGISIIYIVTKPFGVGIDSDSASYLEVASNFLKGKGITNFKAEFSNHYPPVFSLVISIISFLFNINLHESGRIVSLISLFFFLFFFNLILKKKQYKIQLVIMLNIILLSSSVLTIFTILWSETIFFSILSATAYVILLWLEDKQTKNLVIIALLFGLMTLTRYAGIAFFGAFAFFLFFLQKSNFKNRFKNTIIFTITFIFEISIWFIYSKISSGNSTNRDFNFHPIVLYHIKSFIITIFQWLYPIYSFWGACIIGIILILSIIFYKKLKKFLLKCYKDEIETISIYLLLIITYCIFLIFSVSFFDAQTPYDYRILSPIFPISLLLSAIFIEKTFENKIIRKFIYIFALSVIAGTSYNSYKYYIDFYKTGFAYTSEKWQNSETLKMIPVTQIKILYSNGSDVVGFYYPDNFDKIFMIPRVYSPNSLLKNINFESEFDKMKNDIVDKKSVLIFFNRSSSRTYLASKEYILRNLKGSK